VTHEYTILVGGRVLGTPKGTSTATAIAWAEDTVLAVGGDDEVLAISRGDSRVAVLRGALVAPATGGAMLEPGSPADFAILDAATGLAVARIIGGRLVEGGMNGLTPD